MNKLLQLLGITESEYNNFLFDSACQYAESYLGTERADLFINSPEYWIWYRTQFEAADAEFVARHNAYPVTEHSRCPVTERSRSERINQWKQRHHVKYMQVYPSAAVIRAAGGILRGKAKREVHHG